MNTESKVREKTRGRFFVSNIIGTSFRIQEVVRLIEKIADSPLSVLITGESGTGKELIARTIHYSSSRFGKPFIDINCAALPESLLESELFGIEKGVATGVERRIGKIEMANGGTLFLDEIGDMSLPAQAKLLRVLQERKLERVGGRSSINVDVRILAATNKELKEEIKKGSFREDLYYRLNVIHIHMPPLREMKEDIPLLAQYFLSSFASELGRGSMHFSSHAMECLVNYSWPGNVRELENGIKRAATLADSEVIDERDLSDNLRTEAQKGSASGRSELQYYRAEKESQSLKGALEEHEISLIKETLEKNRGNKQKTAKILGLTRQGLIKKIKKYEKALAPIEIYRQSAKQKDKGTHISPKKAVPLGSRQAERRHLTVMFCDLVGFTAISEQIDPEDLHEIVRAYLDVCSKVIRRFEGHITKYFGDGLLVYFGYPSAHEDDAQRAVRTALEIVEAIQKLPLDTRIQIPLQVRVGIHTGLVVIGGMGVENVLESIAIVGETPNVATQLLSVAEPNTVVISSATYQLVEGLFEYHYLGLHTLKGFSTPLDVYRVLHESGIQSRFDVAINKGLTPLVGREQEAELLLERWEQVKEGAGQVVTIIGDAGIGKSRLLYELRKLLEDENVLYLEGRCISYGKSISYLPVTDIIKKRFRIDNLDAEITIREKIEKGIRDIDPNLEGGIPFLYDILSIETDALKSLDLRNKRKRTFETLKNVILADSNLRLLVLAVENLHWIDSASEEFLTFLIDNIPSSKIMLILTSRPGYRAKWIDKSYHIQVALSRLSDKEVEEMIKSILDSKRVNGELIKLVTNKADGIPFYVEEIIKSFTEAGIIVRREDGYSVSKSIAEVDVPDTIQDIIMARIDRLDENLKNTLQYASVIGREFPLNLLRKITDMGDNLEDDLRELISLEFIYEKKFPPEKEYIFKHALTQDVAYQSLLIKKRRELHEVIGDAIKELYEDRLEEYYNILAHHYKNSENKEKALHYLILAGDKAVRLYSHIEAKSYYEEALELLRKLPKNRENQIRTTDVILKLVGELIFYESAKTCLKLLGEAEKLAEELKDETRLAKIYYQMGITVYYALEHPDIGIKFANRCLEIAKNVGDEKLIASAYYGLASLYFKKGDFPHAIELFLESITLNERVGNVQAVLHSLGLIGTAYSWMGNLDKGGEYIWKSIKMAEKVGEVRRIASGYYYLGHNYVIHGHLKQGVENLQKSINLFKDSGDIYYMLLPTCFLGYGYARLGDTKKGIGLLEKNLLMLEEKKGFYWWGPLFHALLGESYLRAGDISKALAYATKAVKLAKKQGNRFEEAYAYRTLGAVYTQRGSAYWIKAETCLNKSIELIKETGAAGILPYSYLALGLLYKRQGQIETAKDYLEQALPLFEKLRDEENTTRVRMELNDLK